MLEKASIIFHSLPYSRAGHREAVQFGTWMLQRLHHVAIMRQEAITDAFAFDDHFCRLGFVIGA
jgi:hypothetical protein